MAVVAGGLLLVVALAGAGLAIGGGLPTLGQLAASPTPSATSTPAPTPNWRAPLLAAFLEACGEPLDRSELQGLTRAEAESLVSDATRECREDSEGKGGKGKGHGHGNGEGRGPD